MNMKVFVITYGCQMNVYDSNKMFDILHASHKFEKTEQASDADLILLNTCSIREKAEEKVYSELGRILKIKKASALIGVGGCVASQEGEKLMQRAPYVDFVFGPQSIQKLPELIDQAKSGRKHQVATEFTPIAKFDALPKPRAEGPSAFVSIMEGCSKWCSYCIVPYTRGQEISRKVDDVINEIIALAKQGVKEVNLLGQNVNDYNGELAGTDGVSLAVLIHAVAEIEGIERIRFTTSHPVAFSDELIEAFAEQPKLVNHLHLPVQSGSDRILSLMKRGYTSLEYRERIKKLRAVRPDISLSSDFIVGFPGETEQDFLDTMNLIEKIGFDHSFSFIYSRRPGTPAAQLPDDVLLDTKKQRLKILQTRLLQQANAISANMHGKTESVLVIGYDKKQGTLLTGRTENNRVVHFKGGERLIGQVAQVKITQVNPNSLLGELI